MLAKVKAIQIATTDTQMMEAMSEIHGPFQRDICNNSTKIEKLVELVFKAASR